MQPAPRGQWLEKKVKQYVILVAMLLGLAILIFLDATRWDSTLTIYIESKTGREWLFAAVIAGMLYPAASEKGGVLWFLPLAVLWAATIQAWMNVLGIPHHTPIWREGFVWSWWPLFVIALALGEVILGTLISIWLYDTRKSHKTSRYRS